jgi:hypothetical protein
LSGATLVDKPRAAHAAAQGSSTWRSCRAWPFALTLEWGAPLTFPWSRVVRPPVRRPGPRSPPSTSRETRPTSPSSGLVTRRTIGSGRTIVEATLDPGSTTEVWWSMRDSAPVAATREVRTLADVMTLLTLGDADVRMVALIDVTVVQGEPRTIAVRLPSGYELTSISGSSLESSEPRDGSLLLALSDPAARRHQFLVSLERLHEGGSFALERVPTLPDVGANAVRSRRRCRHARVDRGGSRRHASHRCAKFDRAPQSLARQPILTAFRYQRTGGALPSVAGCGIRRRRPGRRRGSRRGTTPSD